MGLKTPFTAREIKGRAHALGFSHCGITGADESPAARERFIAWLDAGHHAGLSYLERNIDKRFNPSLLLEWATTAIVLARRHGDADLARQNRSGIAMYAWGEDYHTALRRRAEPLLALLQSADPSSRSRFFTDTAPLSERSLAVKGGMGWIGSNGMLIIPGLGSMVSLSVILTTIILPPDPPFTHNHCGTCTLCAEACPTEAILTGGLIDAGKCIAYHTNSSSSPIPQNIAEKMECQVYGCDICQQVCPWNEPQNIRDSVTGGITFPEGWPQRIESWASIDALGFQKLFKGSALEQTGFSRLKYQAGLVAE